MTALATLCHGQLREQDQAWKKTNAGVSECPCDRRCLCHYDRVIGSLSDSLSPSAWCCGCLDNCDSSCTCLCAWSHVRTLKAGAIA